MRAADAILALGVILGVAGCSEPPAPLDRVEQTEPPEPPAREPSAVRGRAVVERFECNRCHVVPEVEPPPLMKQCVGCHDAIAEGTFEAPPHVLAEWKGRLHSLPAAPSLSVSRYLHRPEWLAKFLAEPHDLRPGLEATMPRMRIVTDDAEDIAAFLVADAGPVTASPPSADLVDAGRELYRTKQCGTCHAYGGSGEPAPTAPDGLAAQLAPDLRVTRERVRPERLPPWIANPQACAPEATMPQTPMTDDEARALASFVLHAPLEADAEPSLPERLPLLGRKVRYDEVRDRVFRKVCWHCHAQPDLARGDGGPGMTGGFGFGARKLDLSTYESINGGYLDRRGERRSLFKAGEGERPILLEVLLARQTEEIGKPGFLRGMPLGLPSLPPEDIQLVETWIAQGRPR